MAQGANPISASSADVWRNDYTYPEVQSYFGIVDRNENVQPIEGKTLNCFSTNLFIPMELNKDDKLFLYLTGFVKLVELFEARTRELQTETDQWMLYIYCDNMFFEEFNDTVYKKREGNNNNNRKIKGNYGENQVFFKRLLQLYREYLEIIKANKEGKYSFVKLFSFDCQDVKSENIEKGNLYLGHPSTFGSFIRFLPFFDDSISRVFSINVSHAITPKLVYSILKWMESQKELITIKSESYMFQMHDKDKIKLSGIIYKYLVKEKKKEENKWVMGANPINGRHAAGLIGFYKKQDNQIINVNINFFMNIIKKITQLHKSKFTIPLYANYINPDTGLLNKIIGQKKIYFFIYGIDEILLAYFIKFKDEFKDIYFFNHTNDTTKLIESNVYFFNMDSVDDLYKYLNHDEIKKSEEINLTYDFIIGNLSDYHRYLSRTFTDLIGKTQEIQNFLKTTKTFDFITLLNGFDEIKPLIVVESEEQIKFRNFFTYLDFQMEGLIQALIAYYTNGDLVLKVPYVMDEQSSVANMKQHMMAAAGGGKNKKKTKKPKSKLKSKLKSKKIKKKLN